MESMIKLCCMYKQFFMKSTNNLNCCHLVIILLRFILRIPCGHQDSYLQTVSPTLINYFKQINKVIYMSTNGQAPWSGVTKILCISLEMLMLQSNDRMSHFLTYLHRPVSNWNKFIDISNLFFNHGL